MSLSQYVTSFPSKYNFDNILVEKLFEIWPIDLSKRQWHVWILFYASIILIALKLT